MYAEAGEGVLAQRVALQIDELGQTVPALVAAIDTTLVGFLVDVP